jgi:phage gp36-like protein
MAYITQDELAALSAIPTDVLDELDTREPDTITSALDSADATLNGYFAARYKLPLVAWGADVKQCAADVAAYRLMSRHGYASEGEDSDLRQRYEDALKWLENVVRGMITPDVAVTSPSPTRLARVHTSEPRGW